MQTTTDDILYGKIKLEQPRQGPRVTADTVLLAHFAAMGLRGGAKKNKKILEMGCASGGASLIAALKLKNAHVDFEIHGFDIQDELVDMAVRNAQLNEMHGCVKFYRADIKELKNEKTLLSPPYDAVMINPPYEEGENNGRQSAVKALALAVHGDCSLEDVFKLTKKALKSSGKLYMVIRSKRLSDACVLMREYKTEPKVLLPVYPKPGRESNLTLIEAIRDAKPGIRLLEPLFIEDVNESYTENFLSAYEP